MAVENIPVLREDYPLFDWSDFPNSLAALVSGGLVAEFEKEAWNAIIEKLSQALSDAGLSWDSTYTTAEGAKITEEYGDLYADVFNSVRHNINHPAPLRWAWNYDSSFRGHVGRKDFRGVERYGESGADDVYPEYIIELVRRLNLLIEIMRGNGPISDMSATEMSETLHDITLRLGEILEVSGGKAISCSNGEACVQEVTAARIQANSAIVETKNEVTCIAEKAARVSPEKSLYKTRDRITSHTAKATATTPNRDKISSLYEVLVLSGIPIDMYVPARSASMRQAQVYAAEATHINGEGTTAAKTDATVTTREATAVSGRGKATSREVITMDFAGATGTQAQGKAQSIRACAVLSQAPMPAPQGRAATLCSAVLSTAWYPPVWVDGGLWIRQSHSVTQNEKGELVIT